MSATELRRKCSKCHITATAITDDDANLRFHRFPLPGKHGSLKAQVWAEYCYPAGNWSTEESLRSLHQQHKMLCSKHFDDSSYTSSSRKRLNNFAIPTGTEGLMLKLRQEQCATASETSAHITGMKLQESALENTPNQPCLAAHTSEFEDNFGSACNGIACWKWDITPFTNSSPQLKYAVVILNRPVTQNLEFIRSFWNNASVRITVDGGTKQWDRYISAMSQEEQQTLVNPDMITGDFDSITEEILEKYKKKGCKAVHTPDQNYTDFTKALMELNLYCQQQEIEVDHIIALSQSSGRLDQILGNIQTLFLVKEKHLISPDTKVYMISDDAVSWLLAPGNHEIAVPEETRKHKRAWCSLVPIGEACDSVTTSGLKWNLDDKTLKFGDIVSTSNTFDGSELVFIRCSHTILWSMRMPSLLGP